MRTSCCSLAPCACQFLYRAAQSIMLAPMQAATCTLFSVVTSRSVASAGLLTRVTIFIRSTSIKPQCFGCLWRLHHADQTGTSGFSGSRYFLPAFFGWCRGTLVTSGLVLPRGRIFLYTSPFHFFFRGRARLVSFFLFFVFLRKLRPCTRTICCL